MAVWRNWLTLKRYKLEFVFGMLSSALFGFGMLLFVLAFDPELLESTLGTTNWISYIIFGVVYQVWQGVALWGSAEIFREELGSGLIDYSFTCPFSRYKYIISNVGAKAVLDTFGVIPMFAVGLWFTHSSLSIGGLVFGLAATTLSVGSLAQMGACFAALVLRHQHISSIFSLFNFAFQMLTGMFIPLQIMPAGLRIIGIIVFPQSLGMDLLRHYLMGTQTLLDVPVEWLIMLTQFVVLGMLAQVAVRRLERSAREEGLHYL